MDLLIPKIQTSLDLGRDWIIDQVLLDIDKQSVLLYISHSERELTCPETGDKAKLHDHTQERVWRHLDLWGYKCFIHCRVPRIACPSGIKTITVPWGDAAGQFTSAFEHSREESVPR